VNLYYIPFRLLNFMCLHALLCSSVELIKFDIDFTVSCFFFLPENVNLLLILKCLVHYLGFSLIVILAYGVVMFSTLRRLLCF